MTKHYTSYGSLSESIEVVEATLAALRVSAYKLCDLIGLPQRFQVYRWSTGLHRPSQKYVTRMNRLLTMRILDRVDFRLVDRVTWPECRIVYKAGIEEQLNRKREQVTNPAPNQAYRVSNADAFFAGTQSSSPETGREG